MLLLAAVVLAGIVIGLFLGGSIASLADIRLRWWGLAIGGLALQVAMGIGTATGPLGWLLLAASYGALLVFLAANLAVSGMAIVATGIALNALVIALNGGMPVSDSALRAASGSEAMYREARASLTESGAPKHHLADASTDVLLPLSDVVGVGWPVNQVFSVGDLVATAGIGWVLAIATRGPAGKHRRRAMRARDGARGERRPVRTRAPRHAPGAARSRPTQAM